MRMTMARPAMRHDAMECIQDIIEAKDDAQLIVVCADRKYGHTRGQVCATMSSGDSTPPGPSHGLQEVTPVTPEQKRHLVERMATCDGPLACHVLQRCLQRYVSTTRKQNSDGKRPTPLEEWLIPVLGQIVDCLEQVRDNDSETLTTTRRLRCATFLLQMCSTILKTDRGASHPERADRPSIPLDTSSGDIPMEVGHRLNSVVTTANSECEGGETSVADACAELSAECLHDMVQTASEIMRVDQTKAADDVISAGKCGGADVVLWVLSLASDVLKHFGKKGWTFSRGLMLVCPERTGEHFDESTPGAAASQTAATFGAKNQNLDVGTDEPSSANGPSWDILDISGLASVVTLVPVEGGSSMVDVVLKWLEVTQLLAAAAKAMTSPSTLEIIFTAVPVKLWRLTRYRWSLLPSDQRPRSPGAAFVDPDGASGALSQAMLRLTFSMIRLQSEGRLLAVQGGLDGGRHVPERAEEGKIGHAARTGPLGQERTAVPWSSAVEALLATCHASCSDEGERGAGFGAGLMRVFCDQDDALVDMLLTNLHIYRNANPQVLSNLKVLCSIKFTVGMRLRSREKCLSALPSETQAGFGPQALKHAIVGACQLDLKSSGNCSGALRDLYRRYLHPASLFAALLSEVGFDSGVLLDWLISPETSFLQYLTLFLRFAVAEWSDFATLMSGVSLLPVEGDGSCDATANGDEQELVLSEEEARRLAKAISCLSGLAASARGLEKRRLLPYNLTPLLKRIDEIVELYEQCGDADECGMSDY